MAGRNGIPVRLPGDREEEMHSWVDLVQVNMGSSELDTDEVNFGVTPDEEAVAEISPPLKIGNKNKKRSKNFNEKEDILFMVQQTCVLYKDADQDNRSFGLLHCWNLLQHAQKWKDLPCNNINNNNKKQKTSSNATPGTNESHHADEEEGLHVLNVCYL